MKNNQDLYIKTKQSQKMKTILYLLTTFLLITYNNGQEIEGVCSKCNCTAPVIDCRNSNLKASFKPEAWKDIAGNAAYTEAKLDHNKIGHVTQFPSLPITRLSLRDNAIVKIDDYAFKNLTSLVYLDLSKNELTTRVLMPNVFAGNYVSNELQPIDIEVLDLSSNEIHALHQDLFEHFPRLKRLYLQRNPLTTIDYGTRIAIASLPTLEVLDLSYTKISELPEAFLHVLDNLQELNLKGNFFTEIPDNVLADGKKLRILNLNDNPIKVLSSQRPFPRLEKLEQLHISFMSNLTRIEDRALSNLINLEYLDCKSNALLEFISPDALSRIENGVTVWPNITHVDLNDNALIYLDFDMLGPRWIELKHLNLLGNQWSCDCENQWILSQLIKLLKSIKSPVNGLRCAEPPQMKGTQFITLYNKNYTMRCLDYYNNHPERDGTILIGVFVIIVLSMVLTGIFLWRRNTGCSFRQGGRVNYSKAFYRPAESDEPERF